MFSLLCGTVTAGIMMYLYRLFIQGPQFTKATRLDGKVVLITGANTGIGKETAIDLAKRGAKVYMACRSVERGEAARKEVVKISRNPNVLVRRLDLASMNSIHRFVHDFLEEEVRLDILINNAGVMACPKAHTEDGFEMQLGTNHLGHFLLTNLLLDLLKKSGLSRVVTVSSMLHMDGKICKEDLNSEMSYSPLKAYYQSKLANVMFTRELSRRLKGTRVTANSLHPGVINTDLNRHFGETLTKALSVQIVKPLCYLFAKTPKAGAQTTIMCAVDPELENVSGEYFSDCAVAQMNPLAMDEELCQWLWTESERYTNLNQKRSIVTNL